jgi:hypothetical protein
MIYILALSPFLYLFFFFLIIKKKMKHLLFLLFITFFCKVSTLEETPMLLPASVQNRIHIRKGLPFRNPQLDLRYPRE